MKGMKKVFDYSDEDNILDVLHTRIACGFYHCLAISYTFFFSTILLKQKLTS